jgi:3-phytase
MTIVTAGNRRDNSIAIYRLDQASRRLVEVAARELHPAVDTYGSCMYHSPRTGRLYYLVTSKTGGRRAVGAVRACGRGRRPTSAQVPAWLQTEGCVAEDELGSLFLSEERQGIWRYDAEPDARGPGTLVDGTHGAGHLSADVEGLTIAHVAPGSGFLIASSQGDSSFRVYRRATPQ